jgi:chromosome segregation ATPase
MLSNRMSQHLLHRELRQQVEEASDALKPSLAGAMGGVSSSGTAMAVAASDTGQLMDDAYLKQEAPPANESTNVALRGVIAALQQLAQNTAMAVEQSNQTVNAQTEALRANAQIVLQLAHAFHNISTETTGVAKTALKSQQKLGEHHQSANEAVGHWEDVRGQLMKTASNLRKAGEASRLLSQAITALPKDQKAGIAELMTQTREALRDAVGGLAESTAQLNYGEKQAKDVSKALGDTQQQWIELLNRIEVCAGTASAHTQTALGVSKNLSRAASPGVKLLEPGKQG